MSARQFYLYGSEIVIIRVRFTAVRGHTEFNQRVEIGKKIKKLPSPLIWGKADQMQFYQNL